MLIGKMMRGVFGEGDKAEKAGSTGASSGNRAAAGMSAMISDEYRHMQEQLHQDPDYGVASLKYAPMVARVIKTVGAQELLDYGAGKGRLGVALKEHLNQELNIRHYDPAIPAWSAPPAPCNFVACIDVLEHIEPDLLEAVLDDLQRVTARVGIFSVHTGAARRILPDGRNAHLIQKPAAWWMPQIFDRFELMSFDRMPAGFWVVVERRQGAPQG